MTTPIMKVAIDAAKLENYILKNFSSRQAFCNRIGRSDSWMNESLKRGHMSLTDVMAIKGAYGIDIAAKEPVKKSEEAKSIQPVEFDGNAAKMCNIMLDYMRQTTEIMSDIKDLLTVLTKDSTTVKERLSNIDLALETVNIGLDIVADNQDEIKKYNQIHASVRPVVNIHKHAQ